MSEASRGLLDVPPIRRRFHHPQRFRQTADKCGNRNGCNTRLEVANIFVQQSCRYPLGRTQFRIQASNPVEMVQPLAIALDDTLPRVRRPLRRATTFIKETALFEGMLKSLSVGFRPVDEIE
jgi:hypothetical protein